MAELKQTTIITSTYEYENGFMIDIVRNENMYEIYLYHKTIGIKELMFGIDSSKTTKSDLKRMILANLEFENYIHFYKEEYMEV